MFRFTILAIACALLLSTSLVDASGNTTSVKANTSAGHTHVAGNTAVGGHAATSHTTTKGVIARVSPAVCGHVQTPDPAGAELNNALLAAVIALGVSLIVALAVIAFLVVRSNRMSSSTSPTTIAKRAVTMDDYSTELVAAAV